MAPERIKGTTQGQRVINYAITCASKSNFLEYRHVLVLLKPGAFALFLEITIIWICMCVHVFVCVSTLGAINN